MGTVRTEKRFFEKDNVEKAVDAFSNLKNPGLRDLRRVKVIAQVEQGLDVYRAAAKNMTTEELEDEQHYSDIMAKVMELTGDPRPHVKCHAHAIVSGAHKYAAELRAVLAWLQLRIDDPDNGCWLPKNTAAKAEMPEWLRGAVPHSRIHRFNYYFWLDQIINTERTPTQAKLRQTLKMIEMRLQSGSQPVYVMKKKGQGIPV